MVDNEDDRQDEELSQEEIQRIIDTRLEQIHSGEVKPISVGIAGKYKVEIHPDLELPDGVKIDELLGVLAELIGEDKDESGSH